MFDACNGCEYVREESSTGAAYCNRNGEPRDFDCTDAILADNMTDTAYAIAEAVKGVADFRNRKMIAQSASDGLYDVAEHEGWAFNEEAFLKACGVEDE